MVLFFLFGCIQPEEKVVQKVEDKVVQEKFLTKEEKLEKEFLDLNVVTDVTFENGILNVEFDIPSGDLLNSVMLIAEKLDVNGYGVLKEKDSLSHYLISETALDLFKEGKLTKEELIMTMPFISAVDENGEAILDSRKAIVERLLLDRFVLLEELDNKVNLKMQGEFSEENIARTFGLLASLFFDKEVIEVDILGRQFRAKTSDLMKYLYVEEVDVTQVYDELDEVKESV